MTIITTITDDAAPEALLALFQYLSPGFPTGAFAYSHGLEWVIAAGGVEDAAGLEIWLADLIATGSGRIEAILLAAALRPDADAEALADWARALAGSGERLRETEETGAAFARAAAACGAGPARDLPLPVAVGLAAGRLGLPPALVVALHLQAFAANLAGAAVRLVPLGQSEGQAVLARLRPTIMRVAAEAVAAVAAEEGLPLAALGTATFRAEMAAMHHETMEPRMFRT
jgi:urease accessory protein